MEDRCDTDADIVPDHDDARARRGFTEMQTRAIAALIGLDINGAAFDVDMFRRGLDVELEHGRRDPQTNVTDDDPFITGKIAWAHLKELPDYYDRLEVLERVPTSGEPATRRDPVQRTNR
jgi:hypothetical protein